MSDTLKKSSKQAEKKNPATPETPPLEPPASPGPVLEPQALQLAQIAATLAAGKVCENFRTLKFKSTFGHKTGIIPLDKPPVTVKETLNYYSELALKFYQKAVVNLDQLMMEQNNPLPPCPDTSQFPMLYADLVDWYFPSTCNGSTAEKQEDRKKREALFDQGLILSQALAYDPQRKINFLASSGNDLEKFYANLKANKLSPEEVEEWNEAQAKGERDLKGMHYRYGKPGAIKPPDWTDNKESVGMDEFNFHQFPLDAFMKFQWKRDLGTKRSAAAKTKHEKAALKKAGVKNN